MKITKRAYLGGLTPLAVCVIFTLIRMLLDSITDPYVVLSIKHYVTHPGFLTGLILTMVAEITILIEHFFSFLSSRFDKSME